jgi:calcineurin-like phosphoesterase family protein
MIPLALALVLLQTPARDSVAVLVGAGDIASCGNDNDEATAKLLDSIPGVVFTAGDDAYPKGSTADFARCYEPTWGRHKRRTRPAPGNHEYRSAGAAPYFAYFGRLAGDSGLGYYSYDLAGWHIISLNSNIPMEVGSPQEQWLRADLARHPARCTLAYWHHPRFSSGVIHGSGNAVRPLWQALYDAHADVIVSGHEHNYERFAPQRPDGTADPVNGIRQFVAGTGGASRHPFGPPIANSEKRNNTHGVLKLTLRPNRYRWEFVPVAGGTFRDSGSGRCH